MPLLIDPSLDGHVHTRLCLHAGGEMEEYVLAAIERGLACLTFLEHLEVGITYHHRTWLTEEDFAYYFKEGERLQRKYRGQLRIRLGIEAGYNPERVDELQRRLAGYPCETVGLSYHFFRSDDRHFNLVSRDPINLEGLGAIGLERVADAYFTTLIEAVQNMEADVLCHLDAVLRHHPEMTLTASQESQIEVLFSTMAAKGMALEINTSGYPNRSLPYPDPRFIARALAQGIPLRAGSDAHAPSQVGRYFDRLPDLIASANSTR